MTSFILFAGLITIAVLLLLVRPLLRNSDSIAYERNEQNIHFARERLKELEQQLNSSSISANDYESLKLEIESTLAGDIELDRADSSENVHSDIKEDNVMLVVLLCIVIPFAALTLYMFTGTPAAVQLSQSAGQEDDEHDIDAMLAAVELRLKNNPEDAQGWAILARSYLARGQYNKSIQANQALVKLIGEDPDVYAQMADAAAMAAKGDLAGQPREYVKRTLQLDPAHPQGLWLAGLAEAQRGNMPEARNYWERLMPLLSDSPQQQAELREIMQKSQQNESSLSTAKPTNAQATETAPEGQSTGVRVRVSIDADVANLAPTGKTVFVFARAQSGPRAPLAVKRLRVADLPAEVNLSDQDAMMPQFKLSLFENIVISARVSMSGDPVASSGDIQSEVVESSNSNSQLIELNISRVLD